MADDFSDDDEAVGVGGAAFDPAPRMLHAAIAFYAHNQLYTQLQLVCSRALSRDSSNAQLRFWSAFASHKLGQHEAAIELLNPLADERDLALASVALLLTAENSRASRDKKRLIELKQRLKVVSKASSEASLLLAGRFFLYSGKVGKARQCVEKLLAKDKKNVDLLALFGWIYLLSPDPRHVEKSMMVFKKAAKLSLPNFDIVALLGRARYFECEGKLSKCVQALDSIIKIYPSFLPALEERTRVQALAGKWQESARNREELQRRRHEEGLDESVHEAYAVALESVLTESSVSRQMLALQRLGAALEREEPNATGSSHWRWQCAQLFARLSRGSAVGGAPGKNPLLPLLASWLAPPLSHSQSAKGGPSVQLTFESAYVSFQRGEWEEAMRGFQLVAAAPLTPEKGDSKDDDKEGEKDAAAAAAAPRFNEDERFQRAQAHAYVALTHLARGEVDAAQSALDSMDADTRSTPPPSWVVGADPASTPLASAAYAAAELAMRRGDKNAAAARLSEYLDAHMNAMKDRQPAAGPPSSAGVQAVSRYFVVLDPILLVRAADRYFELVDLQYDSRSGIVSPRASRPSNTHPSLLNSLTAALRQLVSVFPGCVQAWIALTLALWIAGEDARSAAEQCERLEGESEARVAPLLALLNYETEPSLIKPAPAAAAVPTSSSVSAPIPSPAPFPSISPSPARTPSPSPSPSAAPAVPNTAQRRLFRAALSEETGLPLDDWDEEEDVDALFKTPAEVGGETRETDDAVAKRAEREAQAALEEMEARAAAASRAREAELRAAEEARLAAEAARRRQAEEMARQAELDAKAALERANKHEARLAEQRKADQIAALRAAREAEKRRQAEEIDRAEREREEARERERAEQERMRAAGLLRDEVTTIEAVSGAGPEPLARPGSHMQRLKWNFPHEAASSASAPSPSPSPTSASLALSPTAAGNPLSPPSTAAFRAPVQQQPQQQYQQQQQPAPSPTAHQIAHHHRHHSQRSEESRMLQEKKDKIMQAGLQIEQAKKFTKVAFWGEVFLKHGRRGSPHERNVTLEVTGSELKFDWSSGQLRAHKNDIQLVEGKQTPVFQRNTAEKSKAERCFSIVTAARTLDLEAPTEQAREYWVTGISLLLKYLR